MLTGKPDLTTANPITNDGFWSDVDVAKLLVKYRVPSEYANDTITWGLSLAVIKVNEKIERVKTIISLLGHATFVEYITDNPNEVVGMDLLEAHYEHAVYSRAKAFLLQQFKTMNRREIAENEAKQSAETEQFWLDESQKSIASILDIFFPLESHPRKSGFYVSSL